MPLTQNDLNQVRTVIKEELSGRSLTQNEVNQIEDIIDEKLTEKLHFIPSTELFLEKMAELMKEIQATREEQTAHAGQHQDISDRLETIEEKLGLQA